MYLRFTIRTLVMAAGLALAACAPTDPPTITPPAPSQPLGAPSPGMVPGDTRGFTITMPPPAAGPVSIDKVVPYLDAEGKFSLDVPDGWTESRHTAELTGDAKLGTVFVSPNKNGILSITHFDNGKVPESLGGTANGVMKLTGITDEPDFKELSRTAVIDRPGGAMISEVSYTRRNSGIPMHALLLFQLDGTTFSLVNLAVEQGSWAENEGMLRDILATYHVPASTDGT